jgi:hypothetical protein
MPPQSPPPSNFKSSEDSGESDSDTAQTVAIVAGSIAGGALFLAIGIALFMKINSSMSRGGGDDYESGPKRKRRQVEF